MFNSLLSVLLHLSRHLLKFANQALLYIFILAFFFWFHVVLRLLQTPQWQRGDKGGWVARVLPLSPVQVVLNSWSHHQLSCVASETNKYEETPISQEKSIHFFSLICSAAPSWLISKPLFTEYVLQTQEANTCVIRGTFQVATYQLSSCLFASPAFNSYFSYQTS